MKMLVLMATLSPAIAFAQSSFYSQGVGYFCYQDYGDARTNAHAEARLDEFPRHGESYTCAALIDTSDDL